MKSCLICDDHMLVREALAGAVRLAWPDARITMAGDFPAAWSAAPGHDFCIADLMMPGADPRTGIAGLQRAQPGMSILVVTGTEDDALMLDLLDLEIAGFASKTASSAIIEAALHLIVAGGRYLPPRLAGIAASRIDTGVATPLRDPEAEPPRLTDRQLTVLRLAARGHSNKEIAQSLDLAPATIKTHLANIQSYLGARNRTDAARKAREMGML